MINAVEAREKTLAFRAQKEKERKERIIAFCDNEATQIIKEKAEKGETRAVITNCPDDIRVSVIQTLRDKGNFAVVDNSDCSISVCW